MLKWVPTIVLIFAVVAAGFVYREPVKTAAWQIYTSAMPCSSLVTYRLGDLDERFGLSETEAVAALKSAEAVWEKGASRDLFTYDRERGTVVVNFVYDYRQEAIDTLKPIGINIEKSQGSYDQLKDRYERLKSGLDGRKADLDGRIDNFQRSQEQYNAEVQKWNSRGGAPQDVYKNLQQQKASLTAERDSIQRVQDSINSDIEVINALATSLNRLAHDMNIQAAEYNAIGRSTGGEFEEGTYESSLGQEKITIFEFGDKSELVRVLAHELGHALGLEHVEEVDAIMYRLNQSTNDQMTAADLAEMERVCGFS